jgi:predicted nucleic acid-binding protein
MTAAVFVDSNVLLSALDQSDLQKQKSARAWRSELWVTRRGRISFQVLNEFYVNAIRIQPAARSAIRAEIRDLLQWNPVTIDAAVLELGWKLQDRYQLSYWDALIVAAAKAASCPYLLSEDFQAGQKLDGIQIINPFLKDPWSISS